MQLTLEELKNLFKTLEAGGVADFEYQDEKYRVKVSLGRAAATPVVAAVPGPARSSPVAAASPVAARPIDDSLVAVTSPFVGTFYRAPSPDSPNFCEVGSVVKAGQTLCIVEAMKLMNEIEADVAGTIVDVLVENGKSVEYGQKLFMIKKS